MSSRERKNRKSLPTDVFLVATLAFQVCIRRVSVGSRSTHKGAHTVRDTQGPLRRQEGGLPIHAAARARLAESTQPWHPGKRPNHTTQGPKNAQRKGSSLSSWQARVGGRTYAGLTPESPGENFPGARRGERQACSGVEEV